MVEIQKESQIIIFLSNRIDSMNADETQDIILDALKIVDRDIVIDVTQLNYISSAGLQVVLKCAQLAQEHNKSCFLKVPKVPLKIFFKFQVF